MVGWREPAGGGSPPPVNQKKDGQPARVEVSDTFAVMGLKPGTGDVVPVLWDSSSQHAVFDLDGDPRYDMKALRAQQEAQHRALLDQPPE